MRSQQRESAYRRWVKPVFDVGVAAVLLIVASPVLASVALLLAIAHKGKVLFLQDRVGKGDRIFRVVKFRTMNDDRNSDGSLKPDSERLTKVGSFVRKTSLDELPQLVNVVRGEMSFVGPRPLLPEYLPYYSAEQGRRHTVVPGITGLAQTSGRNLLSWERRFELDVWYVDHQSFLLDCRIVLITAYKILKSEGISAEGHATMPMFSDYMRGKAK